ncbi:cobalt/zinc/cadmium efflux RND transporter, membrane fusion protein, CzcB family [Vibrio sp. JCM 19053]|nr:cobalt/zinc/cadmium efflux RND transporter, membrane fusion protein, CzcB family [Vibrio sp. JCM 19053]
MSTFKVASLALLIGSALGYGANIYLSGMNHNMVGMTASESKSSDEPLYWVAPMDPNYQRDKPGKSLWGWILFLCMLMISMVVTTSQEQ